MVCTVQSRAWIDAEKSPSANALGLESMASLPAVCTTAAADKQFTIGGIRQLQGVGYQVMSASHQVTVLRTDRAGRLDMLTSVMFVLKRSAMAGPAR